MMGLGFNLGIGQQRAVGASGVVPQPIWEMTAGDGSATATSYPSFSGAWAITPTDSGANINTYPEVA